MKARMFAAVVLGALLGVAVPDRAPASDTASIYETLAEMKDHTILFVAATEGREVAALKASGQYTLFAPPDEAFKKLDDLSIQKIASNRDTVRKLIQGHLVVGKLTADKLREANGKELRTVAGTVLKVTDGKDGLRVGGVKVTSANRQCSNGVIHVVDAALPFAK